LETEANVVFEVEIVVERVEEKDGRPKKPCLTYDSRPEDDTKPPVGRFESRRM
jgi:hypothetical protein